MPAPTIPPIGNPENSSFVTELNAALQTLAGEFNSVVYRAGTANMTGDLDTNSRRIFNLPFPSGPTEPMRYGDVADFQGTPGEDGADAALPDWTLLVNTGSPGTDATLDVTGDYPTQTLTFTIPRGTPGASGALSDGVYSGIEVSGTGTALDVVNNHITFARLQDIDEGIIGRTFSGVGDASLISWGTAKTALGLFNVDNTSDAQKPISTATQTALDLKKNIAPSLSDNDAPATPFAPDGSKDLVIVRGLTTNLVLDEPTGSVSHGQAFVLRIKDNGTARTLSWNNIYRPMNGVTLPLTTVAGKTHYIAMILNSTDGKWDVQAVNREA